MSCTKKNYETPQESSKCESPEKILSGVPAYLKGDIIGKEVYFKEGENGVYLLSTPIVNFDAKIWENLSINFRSGVTMTDLQDTVVVNFYLVTPTLRLGKENTKMNYANIESLKILLCKGFKDIRNTNLQVDSLATFVVNYELIGIKNAKNNFAYSSAFGNQQGSTLQVTDVKEFSADLRPKAQYGLQVKYRINCKLYNAKGQYVGDIKNAELVTKYYYEPITQ
jgi:hypothetical protein